VERSHKGGPSRVGSEKSSGSDRDGVDTALLLLERDRSEVGCCEAYSKEAQLKLPSPSILPRCN
jgi:hypothetical protein